MKVVSCSEGQSHSCPKDLVKPMQLDMEENGSQGTPRRFSGSRVSTKSKAPSPPLSVKGLDGAGLSQRHSVSGYPLMTMDQKENLLEQDLTLVVVLPGGVEKTATVHGSKPMMDLLVMLCAKYHLNPSGHTIELVTTNRNHIKFKPNALIGALEAEKVLLKPKGMEEKHKKPGPQMPEATVRLVINYKKTQKTILRVSPRVPLEDLLPAICEKCEFDRLSTLLLRDAQSEDPLDLTCSLNDFAIREVYARDTTAMYSADVPASPTTPTHQGHRDTIPPSEDKTQKEKENKGMFSLFRRSKKKPEQGMTASAPASPVFPSKPRPLSMSSLSAHSSTFNCSTMPSDMPKKRRAPLPPMLVSQSCPSNLSHRQRSISASEPETQTDSDQITGLSRSTESSLKRTKRKAPPPPASPGVVVQDEASLDRGGQPTTLEEIMEQEETTASVVLDSMSDVQEDDSSLNLSTADISVDSERTEGVSPPPDAPHAEMENSPPPESEYPAGEDQSCDLSSDGKLVHSMVKNAECTVPMLSVEMDISEAADVESPPYQAEEISGQTGFPCEDSTTQDGAKGECSTESSPTINPPAAQPVTQSTGTQASDHLDSDPSCDERPVATSTPFLPAEDAQVQTNLTPPCPVSPPQQQEVPPPAKASTSGAVGQKRDMSTSTEELLTTAEPITPALSPASAAHQGQMSTESAPAPPKPSNELTRDYIPKVGMTTYTIVPQKTLEKLRYFEVALTLESPHVALEKEVDIGSLELKDCTTQAEQLQVRTEQTELPSTVPREDSQFQQVHSTTTSESTVNGNVIESIHSPSTPTTILPARDDKIPSPASGGDQAGSIAEVKEMKIPPATKPKPGSFRLPQHKRTPGYYVTSAAVKSLSASPDAGQREAPGSLVAAAAQALQPVGGSFPPPPPPVQWDEETSEGAEVIDVELRPKEEENRSVPPPQPSPFRAPPSPGLSLEKLRSFTAPKPYSPTTPSRFAQAVSSAVKRSQSLSTGSTSPSPRSPPFYPFTSRFLVKDPKGTDRDKEPDVLPSSLSVPEPRKEE
ncbi:cordon-bleu protein-like 1b isoform X1 [Coregonus clupeaformis]|uniref:cordon-bleu protein-like 1b isoform X1 n=2 Tax=Coregonus clupeaformis TaxID=59861 RepID=UPI001E1C649C|nr:cordon-bleu protein-like 1b isoform X1 [Coregonus clupeaformis]